MDSTNSDAKATSTDAGGVSTLPSVYSSGMPPADTPPTTTRPQSTDMVDTEFLRSIDSLLKIVEIVRCLISYTAAVSSKTMYITDGHYYY